MYYLFKTLIIQIYSIMIYIIGNKFHILHIVIRGTNNESHKFIILIITKEIN